MCVCVWSPAFFDVLSKVRCVCVCVCVFECVCVWTLNPKLQVLIVGKDRVRQVGASVAMLLEKQVQMNPKT